MNPLLSSLLGGSLGGQAQHVTHVFQDPIYDPYVTWFNANNDRIMWSEQYDPIKEAWAVEYRP